MRAVDMIGKRFGSLVVTSMAVSRSSKNPRLNVSCDCGAMKTVTAGNLGSTKSCGCLKSAAISAAQRGDVKHGHARRTGKTSEYRAWSHMLQRCTNTNHPSWQYYGARDIRLASEWRGPGGFERFLAHIGPRPSSNHSIDRINNDRNYEPGNVKWSTPKEQANNRRPARERRDGKCKRGHLFSAENTYLYRGARQCRQCHRDYGMLRSLFGTAAGPAGVEIRSLLDRASERGV